MVPAKLHVLSIAAGAVLWASGASAVTFNATYNVTDYNTSGNGGTAIAVSDQLPSLNFNLSAPNFLVYGPINLFKITIEENIGNNDTTSNPIKVNFSFTSPSILGGTVNGTTTGQIFQTHHNTTTDLAINWLAPLALNFNGGSGPLLTVSLLNTVISCGTNGCLNSSGQQDDNWHESEDGHGHRYDSGYVQGQFTLAPPAAAQLVATPIPGALPLFISGGGMLAAVMFRRRRKSLRDAA